MARRLPVTAYAGLESDDGELPLKLCIAKVQAA